MTNSRISKAEDTWDAIAMQLNTHKSLAQQTATTDASKTQFSNILSAFESKDRTHIGFGQSFGEHCTPKLISDFAANLAKRYKPRTVLDPMCGFGLLLASAGFAGEAEFIEGIEINNDVADAASEIWGHDLHVIKGDAFFCSDKLRENYDLIISDPPLGLTKGWKQIEESDPSLARLDCASSLILWSTKYLSEQGRALFVVSPSFFHDKKRSIFYNALVANGCKVSACLHVPPGLRMNTATATYLVLIERGDQDDMFVGQLKDEPGHSQILLNNLARRKSTGHPSLGRLCDWENFSGFDNLVDHEQLERLARAWKWNRHEASKVFTSHEILRRGTKEARLKEDASSIYIKLNTKFSASRQSEELGTVREVAHLKVDTQIVDVSFLEFWFNETRIGQLTVGSNLEGNAIQRLKMESLLKSPIFLPSKCEQRLVSESWSYLKKVRAEADELESALCECSEAPESVLQRIQCINQEDRYEDWLESLPFPLASILWRHHASKESYRQRYEMLLHLFEATAAFVATIHLSAFMSDDALWQETGKDLFDKLTKQKLSLERATFGSWKLVAERLSSACSSLIKNSERDSNASVPWHELYGTNDHKTIEMISSSKLLNILQSANKLRNDWQGHSGAIGEEVARSIHGELQDLVQQLRSVFGRTWNRYELLQPSERCRYKSGVYYITCRRIMGTRSTPFEEKEYESMIPLETDQLYLFNPLSRTGIKLQPFIEVIPSPERRAVACFIFNRVDKDSARWVSYHFDQESEITHPSQGIDSALSMLRRFRLPEQ